MIIHHPEIVPSQGEIKICSRIEFDQGGTNTPDFLWIKFPDKYAKWISPRGDGFLTSLFLIGMFYQEDIKVRGDVSPLLAYHLPDVIKMYYQGWPDLFKQIDVNFNNIKAFESNTGDHRGVGSAFSGGVDSSYTLWSHLPGNQTIPSAQITHGLFLHGFDILLRQPNYYDRLLYLFTDLFRRLNLELIPASTNIYSFYEFRVDWGIASGPPLIGTTMHMERLFGRFYIPSSMTFRECITYGKQTISPKTHHLLSTENLKMILHGTPITRGEKIENIRSWPEIRGTLRVCSRLIRPEDQINCCSCEKCLKLMIYLEIMGDLHKFTSFQKSFRSLYLIIWLWKSREEFVFINDMLKLSWKFKRWDIWIVLLLIYFPGYVYYLFYLLYRNILWKIPPGIKYAVKSRVFPKNI